MTGFEDTRSWYQDRSKLEENYSLKNWFDLIFPHFLLYTNWVCASGLRNYLACDPLDFRFRPQEYGSPEIYQRNPTLIICSGPWKIIHCWQTGKRSWKLSVTSYCLFAWLKFSFIRTRDWYWCHRVTLVRHVRKFYAQFTLNGTFLRKDSFYNSCKCPKFIG